MSNYNRYLIAATDISAQPKMFARFRGKTAKEVYRFTKGIIVSKSVTGPAIYAVVSIPTEMSKGVIYSAIGSIGETLIGYISFIGFARWIYKGTDMNFIKNSARIVYNFACLPATIYSKGACSVLDIIQVSKIEEIWFGSPVYIFDDNRLWIEKNFTFEDTFKRPSEGGI